MEKQKDSLMYVFLQIEKQLAEGPFENASQQYIDVLVKTHQSSNEDVKDVACFLLHKKFAKEIFNEVNPLIHPLVLRILPGSDEFEEKETQYEQALERLQEEDVHPLVAAIGHVWSVLGCMNIKNRQNFLLLQMAMQIQPDQIAAQNNQLWGKESPPPQLQGTLEHGVSKTVGTVATFLARNVRSNT